MIGNDWDLLLKDEYNKDYFKKLINYVNNEYQQKIIYPMYKDIFNALKFTSYKDVRVVILGQDPYHGVGQAHGLSFSVQMGVPKPASLRNIFQELNNDLHISEPNHGNLEKWTKEGVLLLNSVLTVEKNKPASHKDIGWEIFTDKIIEIINRKPESVVFILWGNYAREKKKIIDNNKHLIIESPHPSPYSAYSGFFGSKPFSKTNNFLKQNNKKEIDWAIN
jgi:uracil-DNA glycosylase